MTGLPRCPPPVVPSSPAGSSDNVSAVYMTEGANGAGIATVAGDGTVLDSWYPAPALGSAGHPTAELPAELTGLLGPDAARGVDVVPVHTEINSLADPPTDAYDVYLRLHLLSHRLVRPHAVNL